MVRNNASGASRMHPTKALILIRFYARMPLVTNYWQKSITNHPYFWLYRIRFRFNLPLSQQSLGGAKIAKIENK